MDSVRRALLLGDSIERGAGMKKHSVVAVLALVMSFCAVDTAIAGSVRQRATGWYEINVVNTTFQNGDRYRSRPVGTVRVFKQRLNGNAYVYSERWQLRFRLNRELRPQRNRNFVNFRGQITGTYLGRYAGRGQMTGRLVLQKTRTGAYRLRLNYTGEGRYAGDSARFSGRGDGFSI